jgi:2-methylisocitrate lyase-like PEP mutase family enzyme
MNDRVKTFRGLHEAGCFVMPNPWDAGSAKALEQLGFKALATTSAGFAWSIGRRDNDVTLDEALAHLRAMAASVRVPVNADFEGGFAVEPEDVAANVARAAETGIAGLSIEDSTGDPDHPLFDEALGVARIRAARAALDRLGNGVVLTARSEGFVRNRPDLAATIDRLTAYSKAGADCLFAPGVRSREQIVAIVQAVAPKPVNVIGFPTCSAADLADMGVRRISVGGSLARTAWAGFLAAARDVAQRGSFDSFAAAVPPSEMNHLFER